MMTENAIRGCDDCGKLKPDVVIVMNPIYRQEIAADLAKRGLTPEILAVDDGMNP